MAIPHTNFYSWDSENWGMAIEISWKKVEILMRPYLIFIHFFIILFVKKNKKNVKEVAFREPRGIVTGTRRIGEC